jgi:alpha-tubulin suppressor-like RCC1 family protein
VLVGSGFASASAGKAHSLAIKTNGTLYAWGYNSHGQLGDGTTTQRTAPILIGSGFASAAGDDHSVAIKTNGDLYAWGDDSSGQLGDGTTIDRYSPVLVVGSVR